MQFALHSNKIIAFGPDLPIYLTIGTPRKIAKKTRSFELFTSQNRKANLNSIMHPRGSWILDLPTTPENYQAMQGLPLLNICFVERSRQVCGNHDSQRSELVGPNPDVGGGPPFGCTCITRACPPDKRHLYHLLSELIGL